MSTATAPARRTTSDTQRGLVGGGFDLGALAREVIANSKSPDPGEIADALLGVIPRTHYRTVLAALLRGYVRHIITDQRPAPTKGNSTPSGPASGRASWKQAIGDEWRMRRVHVGGSVWKFLADCTYDDLMANAAVKRDIAEATRREADRSEELAALVKRHNVDRLGDVPDGEVYDVLRRADS